MPGNSIGIYGGFSSHIPVPSIDLCEIKDRGDVPLAHLSVVADAATTPFQAAKRAELELGDNVIVIGVGGVGQYMVQEAKALGAAIVIAVDVVEERLQKMRQYGADFVINATDKGPRDVAGEVKAIRKRLGLPDYGWKIFEATGTKPGQETALSLLSFTGKLIVVGFGMAKVEYSISRLMAFDAEIIGTWGCLPEYYPQVLAMVLQGRIALEPFVQTRPMSQIREAFEEAHHSPPDRRIVLTPDF
jgi:6-hydroxycyclohex-1-ene-1-carbonyl-CoA dehydrogenase